MTWLVAGEMWLGTGALSLIVKPAWGNKVGRLSNAHFKLLGKLS